MAKHLLIFIHGMGEGRSDEQYKTLLKAIRTEWAETKKLTEAEFDNLFDHVFVDWQTEPSQAEEVIFKLCFPNLPLGDLSLWDLGNPVRPLRHFMTFFLGDITAYVSENDNNICNTVWKYIKSALDEDKKYSLIAHSLGSVIAFDYIFNLLERENLDAFFSPDNEEGTITPEQIGKLRKNFCNLFTFGAPIGLFMMRKGELWMQGKEFRGIINPIQGHQQKWLNFYDSEDIIAFPLERLFAQNPNNADRSLKDIKVNTGFMPPGAHTLYWQNKDVAAEIAKALMQN